MSQTIRPFSRELDAAACYEFRGHQEACFLSSKITPKNRVFLPIIVMGIFYRCFISACFIL